MSTPHAGKHLLRLKIPFMLRFKHSTCNVFSEAAILFLWHPSCPTNVTNDLLSKGYEILITCRSGDMKDTYGIDEYVYSTEDAE